MVRTLPGGTYLRVRLQGEPPAIYDKIPSTLEQLVKESAFDASRPTIEFYRSRDVIDLLLPVRFAGVTSDNDVRHGPPSSGPAFPR